MASLIVKELETYRCTTPGGGGVEAITDERKVEESPPKDFDIILELLVVLYLLPPPLWLSQGEMKLLSVAAVASLFCRCLSGIGAGFSLVLLSPLSSGMLLIGLLILPCAPKKKCHVPVHSKLTFKKVPVKIPSIWDSQNTKKLVDPR